jgi:hypothetical protein
MECHEGATMIKTFRGLMADDTQDTILLHTNDGSTGYRIAKFEGIANAPGTKDSEHLLKIYKVPQTTVDGAVDLSDNTLIAVLYYTNRADTLLNGLNVIIADNEVFNQDIYITHIDMSTTTNESGNYYIELEQIKLDINSNTVATLKDMRNTASPRP